MTSHNLLVLHLTAIKGFEALNKNEVKGDK
jgi:hypothetical protein